MGTSEELRPADLAALDCAYWAVLKKIRLGGDVFTFDNGRDYQIDIMRSKARRLALIKGTQLGGTSDMMLYCLHSMAHGLFPKGVIYWFPTMDDALDFSKSRFQPMIGDNQEAIGRFISDTDSAQLKKIGNAFLYLRGARLSQAIGGQGEKESAKARSVPADCCVFDEMDLMPSEVFLKALMRMADSDVKAERYLSNPTLEGVGIDEKWQESDQRHWFRRCGCGEWVSAELLFPGCVKLRPDGTGYIGCPKCGREAGPKRGPVKSQLKGEWVSAVPAKTPWMEGYRTSQLMSVRNDPGEILRDFQNPPQGNLADVHRLRLGLPFTPKEDQLRPGQVWECSGPDGMAERHEGPCAMGVDIGQTMHVQIGIRTGDERFEIIKAARLPNPDTSGWHVLHDLARRYSVRSAVIDLRPYEDQARKFRNTESFRVFLCEYTENALVEMAFDDKTGIVKAYRTGLCDRTHRLIEEKAVTFPRRSPEMEEVVKQICSIGKALVTDKRTGTSTYRYIGAKNDHYRHALNYFYLAARRLPIASPRGRRPVRVLTEYEII